MTKDTSGPAFPTDNGMEGGMWRGSPGMSLRDYFAAKGMQGLMGRVWGDRPAEELFATWSRAAYALADAMLKARETK